MSNLNRQFLETLVILAERFTMRGYDHNDFLPFCYKYLEEDESLTYWMWEE